VTAVVERHRPPDAQLYAGLAGLPLTAREAEVLILISHGKSNGQIGRELTLADSVVKIDIRRILAKLRASNRAHAVRIGAESGVLVLGAALKPAPQAAPVKPVLPPPVLPKLGKPVRDLLAEPPGTILADRFGDAVQRMRSGGFWLAGEQWPHLASEVVDRGPFEVLRRPDGADGEVSRAA
jgi:DNA-binding CsgD family transcriptional regulator